LGSDRDPDQRLTGEAPYNGSMWMLDNLQSLGLRVEAFTLEDGERAERLWEQTRQAGLSLGDRACF